MLITNQITFSANKIMTTRLEAAGEWLKAQRELAGVSQQKAANKSGLHVIHISRAENGRTGLKRETIMKLIEAINALSSGHQIDVDDALIRFGHSTDSQLPPQDAAEFITGLERLGLEGILFDPHNLTDLTEEDYQEIKRNVRTAVELALRHIEQKKT